MSFTIIDSLFSIILLFYYPACQVTEIVEIDEKLRVTKEELNKFKAEFVQVSIFVQNSFLSMSITYTIRYFTSLYDDNHISDKMCA